jgi:response regulator RpfG family c-di-GMP phosphodiesterase
MTARILIVDDDEAFRHLLAGTLRHEYAIEQAASGEECLQTLQAFKPNMVLLDIMMPGIDGYETCRCIKTSPLCFHVQVIMVSAHSSREEQMRAYEMGADDYLVKPVDLLELRSRLQLHSRLHEATQNVLSIKQEIDSRNEEIRRLTMQRTEELLLTQDVAIFTLAKVAESRDQITGGHVLRVRAYSQLLAEELHREGPYCHHVDTQFLENLYRASPLHDIGKVGITDAILVKPDRLSSEEFEQMQEHAVMGANILDQAVGQSPCAGFLAMAACVARFHHEQFDGTGYPAGLVGEEIPLPARIVALADVYDALTSERPYKAARSASHARQIIQSESGRHFDPVIVHAFQNRFAEFLQIRQSQLDTIPLVVGAMSFRKQEK